MPTEFGKKSVKVPQWERNVITLASEVPSTNPVMCGRQSVTKKKNRTVSPKKTHKKTNLNRTLLKYDPYIISHTSHDLSSHSNRTGARPEDILYVREVILHIHVTNLLFVGTCAF